MDHLSFSPLADIMVGFLSPLARPLKENKYKSKEPAAKIDSRTHLLRDFHIFTTFRWEPGGGGGSSGPTITICRLCCPSYSSPRCAFGEYIHSSLAAAVVVGCQCLFFFKVAASFREAIGANSRSPFPYSWQQQMANFFISTRRCIQFI